MSGASRGKSAAAPSNPMAIMEANAAERAERRRVERTPTEWGVIGEIQQLPTSANVAVIKDMRERVIHARRSDAFDLLHAAGGLTDAEHQAARRLYRDFALRAGVKDHDPRLDRDDNSSPRSPIDYMIEAGGRVEEALAWAGPASARVLRALMEPLLRGEIRVWRVIVQEETGKTERHAQGTVVQQACANLAAVYDLVDSGKLKNRRAG